MNNPDAHPYTHEFDNATAFAAHYRRTYCDFVYDAKTESFYTDFRLPHVDFCAFLFVRNGGAPTGCKFQDAEAFVVSGMGLFKSRAGHRVMISEKFELPADLWFLRRDLEYVE